VRIAGSASRATRASRKLALTRLHPGARVIATYSTTPSTSVEMAATTTDSTVWRCR
jgi:hypothetical protein